ncbi:hypothetical protein C482_10976 [Natrialba chahannaoensis JCM 10990]|uniref:Uncharacterized protein n=1 Tax=Natrialba chahannaoensis JCM 10990 TaxID=1227492 RepID=M0ANX5_9EURY|nr:hypothetical protein C482_10976 [Natrialba chahannaoensis JCM 10990]
MFHRQTITDEPSSPILVDALENFCEIGLEYNAVTFRLLLVAEQSLLDFEDDLRMIAREVEQGVELVEGGVFP